MIRIVLGAVFAAAIAYGVYRSHALSRGGAIAAFAVGTVIFAAAGWPGAAVLFAFFIPSTLLSRIGRSRKHALHDVGKQGPRDAWQVLANGGIAALCALLATRGGIPLAAAFAGAFAAASADTWGTEIGTLSRRPPISILTFRRVPTGLSGGITLSGTLATLAGAFFVALVAMLVRIAPLWPVLLGGVIGAFFDSFLGATLQALRWCPACRCECETNPHHCGTPTTLRRGVAWIENDAINFAATLCGASIAGCIAALVPNG